MTALYKVGQRLTRRYSAGNHVTIIKVVKHKESFMYYFRYDISWYTRSLIEEIALRAGFVEIE